MQLGGLGPSTELWDGSGDRFTMVGWMHQRRALHSAPCAVCTNLPAAKCANGAAKATSCKMCQNLVSLVFVSFLVYDVVLPRQEQQEMFKSQ